MKSKGRCKANRLYMGTKEYARVHARARVALLYGGSLKGNVVCHLDQHSLNGDLRNLAVMSKSDHARLLSHLRHCKIPKGKLSKKFAVGLAALGVIEMTYPIREKKKTCIEGFTF